MAKEATREKRHFSILHIRNNQVVFRADYRTAPITAEQHKRGMRLMVKKLRKMSNKRTIKVLELP